MVFVQEVFLAFDDAGGVAFRDASVEQLLFERVESGLPFLVNGPELCPLAG